MLHNVVMQLHSPWSLFMIPVEKKVVMCVEHCVSVLLNVMIIVDYNYLSNINLVYVLLLLRNT